MASTAAASSSSMPSFRFCPGTLGQATDATHEV